jgi:precorrin-6B methylase 1
MAYQIIREPSLLALNHISSLPLRCSTLGWGENLMHRTEILTAIDREIERLQQAKRILNGGSIGTGPSKAELGDQRIAKKRILSPEARKRIADAQKKRWAAQKKAAK